MLSVPASSSAAFPPFILESDASAVFPAVFAHPLAHLPEVDRVDADGEVVIRVPPKIVWTSWPIGLVVHRSESREYSDDFAHVLLSVVVVVIDVQACPGRSWLGITAVEQHVSGRVNHGAVSVVRKKKIK